jgi:hypothetical protein
VRDITGLRWPVHAGHYRWVDAIYRKPTVTPDPDDESRQILAYDDIRVRVLTYPSADVGAREYAPLRSEPALFMTFAKTEPTEESILAFANRYGALGVRAEGHLTPMAAGEEWKKARAPLLERGRIVFGNPAELFDTWKSEIWWMSRTVRLWQILQSNDPEEIARHVKWREHPRGVYRVMYHVDSSIAEPKRGTSENFITIGVIEPHMNVLNLRYGEASRPARQYIASCINRQLASVVSPHLDWETDGDVLHLHFAPRNLIGAIWLQFAFAVAGKSEFRGCKACGRLFEVSQAASRSDKLFCSDACRVSAYRERQEQARQMFAAGKSLKEIATVLDAKADAVKRWVKGVHREE